MVSNIPSLLARATDVTDRDIVSQIELLQEATFPLIGVPEPMNFDQTSGLIWRTTYSFSTRDSRNNQAAATTIIVATLGRGLWRVQISGVYYANFLNEASQGFQVNIEASPGGFNTHLFHASPGGTQMNVAFNQSNEMLLVTDTSRIQAILAGNAVGQIHGYNLSVQASKYL